MFRSLIFKNIPKNLKHKVDLREAKLPTCIVFITRDIHILVPENVIIYPETYMSLYGEAEFQFHFINGKVSMWDLGLLEWFGRKIKPLVKSVELKGYNKHNAIGGNNYLRITL